MLKISDEGLRSFSNDYKRIILNKLRYGNLYSEYLENIYDQSLKLDIENDIEKFIDEKTKLKDILIKLNNEVTNNDNDYEFCEALFKTRIYTEKSMKKLLSNFKKSVLMANQLLTKQDRSKFLLESYPNYFRKISDKYYVNKILSDDNMSEFSSNKELHDKKIKKLEDLILNDKNYSNFKILQNKDFHDFMLLDYEEMQSLINEINKLSSKDEFIEICNEIFDYEKYIDTDLRHAILNKIDINVCPYCGRQFISSYHNGNKKKNTADLDHFFIKSEYPYLALSLFNFVPSCQICNSRMKLSSDFHYSEHLYPYLEGFKNNAVFDIDNSVFIGDIVSGKEKAKVIIDIKNDKDNKISNNIKTFKLDSLYQNHSKNVQDIFRMIQIYSPSYLNSIADVMYDNSDFDNDVSYIEGELSKIKCLCNNNIIDDLEEKLSELKEDNKTSDLAMKAEDMMLLMFREKDNDEILSKLYNDLLDKYWRRNR